MKNYKEVAESVFRRSEEIIEENKKRRKAMMRIGSAVGCFVIAGTVGVGVWKTVVGSPLKACVPITVDTSSGQLVGGSEQSSAANDSLIKNEETSQTESEANSVQNNSNNAAACDTTAVEPSGGSLPFIPNNNANYIDPPQYPLQFTTIIDSYEVDFSACYAAPENGSFFCSIPLNKAMEEYGDKDENGKDIIYHVFVDFCKDRNSVDVNSPEIRKDEWDRLCGLGIQCEFGTYSDNWGETVRYTFGMFITKAQLENFVPNEKYGYIFFLFRERISEEAIALSYPEEYNDVGGAEELNTEEINTEATDAGEPNTEVPDTEEPNTEVSNTGEPNTEVPNTGEPNTGEPNAEVPNTGEPNTEAPNAGEPNAEVLMIIDHYETELSGTPDIPENGKITIAPSLKAAMEKYGDKDEYGNDIMYSIRAELYMDGEPFDEDNIECDEWVRLNKLGYGAGYFTTVVPTWFFEVFVPDESYGFAFSLMRNKVVF